MTTEFDLRCATCGGTLARKTVSPDVLGIDAVDTLPIAECVDCGGRHFPELALERLQ